MDLNTNIGVDLLKERYEDMSSCLNRLKRKGELSSNRQELERLIQRTMKIIQNKINELEKCNNQSHEAIT